MLEAGGADCRAEPQRARRARLEALLDGQPIALSPLLAGRDWTELAALRSSARARGVEGVMLKQGDSRYGTGRTRTDATWWKWKVDPLSCDGVLIYAQAGHGRRDSVYTDYTFAVWNRTPRDAAEARSVVEAIERREPPDPLGLQLVPFAKAYSGLTDAEFDRVDREIRAHTLEKFGPVRSVRPRTVIGQVPVDSGNGIADRGSMACHKRDRAKNRDALQVCQSQAEIAHLQLPAPPVLKGLPAFHDRASPPAYSTTLVQCPRCAAAPGNRLHAARRVPQSQLVRGREPAGVAGRQSHRDGMATSMVAANVNTMA